MLVTYPALFYYDDSVDTKYSIYFPDFKNSSTLGTDISDAMYMASDWLGVTLAGNLEDGLDIPNPSNINHLSLDDDDPFRDDHDFDLIYDKEKSFISMVTVNVSNYLNNQRPIKKTLTIPRWADTLGKDMNLNFSETLTDAIAAKKFIE